MNPFNKKRIPIQWSFPLDFLQKCLKTPFKGPYKNELGQGFNKNNQRGSCPLFSQGYKPGKRGKQAARHACALADDIRYEERA
jgi:hypothetical protein